MKTITSRIKSFGWEAFLFSLTLGLGIVNGYRLSQFLGLEPRKINSSQIELWRLGLYFVLMTLFIAAISYLPKFKKGKKIVFNFFFLVAVSLGSLTVLSTWLPDIVSLVLIVALIAIWFKRRSILIHNLLIILGIAGAGSILGLSFTPELIVLLLLVFSIYDFIAVYKTKHMVKMAKEMVKSGAILGLIIPQQLTNLKEKTEKIKPGGRFMVLGGGDVIFPLILCSSLINESLISALIVAFFSLIGLLASFLIFTSQKIKRAIPALPPIALFSIIGYLVVRFLI